ncbi:sigma-54-dependent transcriptional regulator [Hymenobacter psychrotolerans]|uniref:DNA-binding transcriptional response regulator, NtrC family, contains REC, AAA-type ATPase, and a Fis-type DNA-binding domains n=1 Tax=Hymenobacter psychrotolerans DSM 18569 TaxID=1121959 RepID=A0A1M7C080_9BACT|nr:sigma-54 dependent transcriptional regulator [Hymenobacter psychrotolerans]SHL60708.1 DNA-binding transcriptional response regulator, NtrC family, contains REC, AAA-type ATPase, and a Fis-type DNA-binding domains [Hymenobacter psychrotolerans DSM 18569]
MSVSAPVHIFIVEDNAWYGELLEYKLTQNPDYHIQRFTTAQACLDHLGEKPDLITLDYSLPDGKGDQVLQRIKERLPEVAVIIISGQEDVRTAIGLLRQGAYDYLVKDEETADRLWNAANNVRKQLQLRRENERLREQIGMKYEPGRAILGSSPQMQQLSSLIEKAARTNITVSLSGETGTGKELVAKAIHYLSPRRDQAFVAVNVAAIPRELLESELFGHEKGAFTGAISRRIGRFEEAHRGTLFLDEIAELPLDLQAKLLRVLQEREVARVGGGQPIPFDSRLMVATHRDLAEEVKQGRFREDLYYRLLGLPILLPPLRERGQDVLLLAESFLSDFCAQNKTTPCRFSDEARSMLLRYPFPGNVRELKAVVELAAVLAEHDTIKPQDLSLRMQNGNSTEPLPGQESLRAQVAAIVQRYLDAYQGNILQVAAKLQIGKSTIYRMAQNNEVRLR